MAAKVSRAFQVFPWRFGALFNREQSKPVVRISIFGVAHWDVPRPPPGTV